MKIIILQQISILTSYHDKSKEVQDLIYQNGMIPTKINLLESLKNCNSNRS